MSVALADRPRHAARAPVVPEAPCVHCGLPVGPRPVVRDEAAFCCTGCAVVHEALASAGFGDTYYRLRSVDRARPVVRPVAPEALQIAELDTPRFLAEETREIGGGRRRCELFVDGVHCAACVWLVERMPHEVEGVTSARLDLPRARLTLEFDEEIPLSAVAEWLARFGYAARPARQATAGQRTEAERRLLFRMGVAWALAGNVMLVAFALYSGLDAAGGGLATAARWASLVLAVPAVVYGGAPFFKRAWASARTALAARDGRRLHMDTPIALGIAVGFGHSAWATVTGRGDVWFDSITVLIAALLTARFLQLRSRRLAGEAADRLLTLVPTTARRVGEKGRVEVVRQDELRRGDLVVVPAGEVIAVDGVVVAGESRLDNAVLTGEAQPVAVASGNRVSAGATNLSAPLRVCAEAVGDATRVGLLLAWVRDTDGSRAPVLLLSDRIGGVFLLAVLTLAAATASLWAFLDPSQAAQHTAALLVITCPCALGMATPLAFAVAAGRAARAGLFIKSDGAMQRLTDVDTVVLDKTGTLTEGRMELVEWCGDEDALDLAAILEASSNHPIAAALVRARGAGPEAETRAFEAVAGQGVHGLVMHHHVVVGKPTWCGAQTCQPLSHDLAEALGRYGREGYTPVGVLVDGAWGGVAAFGDRLRDESALFVQALEDEGKAVHMLSGDHDAAVAAVAHRLGLPAERAHGGVSPESKRAAVERLQAEGRVVLMVGDGVNDAAALRAADVGVAVGGGTSASLVAADVFLTRPGLAPLAELLGGARAVMQTIRRLLALSLLYNGIGGAAAVAGLVTPLVAAVAMPMSSLLVVGLAIAQPSFRRSRAAS